MAIVFSVTCTGNDRFSSCFILFRNINIGFVFGYLQLVKFVAVLFKLIVGNREWIRAFWLRLCSFEGVRFQIFNWSLIISRRLNLAINFRLRLNFK